MPNRTRELPARCSVTVGLSGPVIFFFTLITETLSVCLGKELFFYVNYRSPFRSVRVGLSVPVTVLFIPGDAVLCLSVCPSE